MMKILATSNNNTVRQSNLKQQTKLQNSTNYTENNSIAKNSMQEALGRSQVNFTGKTTITDDRVCHVDKHFLSGKPKEEFDYRKKEGIFKYEAKTRKGEVKREFVVIPHKNREIEITVDKEGVKTRTFRTLAGEVQIVEKTDKERGRKVIEFYEEGKKQPRIQVIDLQTNQPVTSGPLVMEEEEDEDGVVWTYNLVTNQTVKMEEYTKDGWLVEYYSEETGKVRKRVLKGKKEITTTELRKDETTKRVTVHNKKTGSDLITDYAKDGKTPVETYLLEYNENGEVIQETDYRPGTQIITQVLEHDLKKGMLNTVTYQDSPNVAVSSVRTNKNNRPIEKCEFFINQEDIRNIQHRTYRQNGLDVEEYYNNNQENTKKTAFYRKNGVVVKAEKYDEWTGNLFERTEDHPTNPKLYLSTQFDPVTENKTKKDTIDRETKLLIQRIHFHSNGKPHIVRDYNPDRSFREKTYDEEGNLVSRGTFNSDATPKY